MKHWLALFFCLLSATAKADSWIHTGATITGLNVTPDRLVIYFKGGTGPCGGNGEWPFMVNRADVGSDAYRSMQSVVMLAYASNKLISVFGYVCENIKQIRVHEPSTYFGNANP